MVGSYNGQQGLSFMFGGDSVTVQGCGKLVPDSLGYSMAKKGDHLLIKVANTPRPFLIDWDPSGKITGPGPVDITGQVITGYRHYWVQKRYAADNTIVPGSAHEESEPIYADKTERCTVGTMTPVVISGSAAPMGGPIGEMLGAVADKFVSRSIGPRMTGEFGSPSGLTADFSDDFVVLDCGQAHIKQPYTVESTANQILVHVQNSGGPFTIAVGPDNTLRGSGSTTVNGRLVTGMRGDDVTYTPRTERCEVGSLAPASGTTSNAVAAAPPAAAAQTTVAPVSSARTAAPAPSGGNAALAVNARLGTGASPLAGQWFGLLNESIETIFRKAGVQPAKGSSAVQAWMELCKNKSPQCQQAMQSTGPYRVGKAQFDAGGKASLTGLASGTYYVLASARFNGHLLLWNERVDVKPGTNAVVLEPANAVPVN
jgi:hypothetical protein